MALSEQVFEAIQEATKPQLIEIGGRTYTTKPVSVVDPHEHEQSALKVATLDGVVEYLEAHPDGHETLVAHVESHKMVSVVSRPFGDHFQRHAVVTARAPETEGLAFGNRMDLETFAVQLQALYAETEDRARVLAVVGNVRDEYVRVIEDDGVTQGVAVKTGLIRKGDAAVPNPVFLAPFRTFREIEQPTSRFILRLQQGKEGSLPTAALHEADGGAWKLEAVRSIKEWLTQNLPDGVPVIG